MDRQAAIRMVEVAVNGRWSAEAVETRIRESFGRDIKRSQWPKKLVERIFQNEDFVTTVPLAHELAVFLQSDAKIQLVTRRSTSVIEAWADRVKRQLKPNAKMQPRNKSAALWQVPSIPSIDQLACQLQIPASRLNWLADTRASEHTTEAEKLRNYRYHWVRKASGGLRLLEAPKASLKQCQRWIADNILCRIPTHNAAHAFCVGRSPMTAALQHTGQHVVLRIDLRDFFPSIAAGRVAGVFRTAGYPPRVVSRLTGLCTNTAWRGVLDEVNHVAQAEVGNRFREAINTRDPRYTKLFQPHLPQGSPASPTLANLCAWSLDCRLTGLAKKFNASYTRYADDLIFSGDRNFGQQLRQFRIMVCAICLDEGFEIRNRKTTVSRKHQQQKVTGIVVNQKPSIARKEYDLLKAILHNCRMHGPESQNRNQLPHWKSHLAGKLAWVQLIDRKKGARLRAIFDEIEW